MLQSGELPEWILDRKLLLWSEPSLLAPCYALLTACLVSQPELLLDLFVLLSPQLSHSGAGSVSANRWEGVWGGRGCQGAPKDHLCGQGMHSPSQGHGNICLPAALHLPQRSRTAAVPAVPGTTLTLNTPEAACGDRLVLSLAILKTENPA